MPVGAARVPLAAYLATFDHLANRDVKVSPPGGTEQVLESMAQRREELLKVARQDSFHWNALARPAELIDFDLLALLLAGMKRGASPLPAQDFASRDALTELPFRLAEILA
jgi:hypothetical protein